MVGDSLMSKRLCIIAFVNTIIIISAFLVAFLLRFEFMLSARQWEIFFQLLPAVVIIKFAIFWKTGLSRGWWRYVSLVDVVDIFKANMLAYLCFMLYVVFVYGMRDISRSVLILDFVLCFLMTCGVRFVTRITRERFIPLAFSRENEFKRILVVGAGCAGQMIVRETWQNPSLKMTIAGFIDDDPEKKQERFQGVPILGTRHEIAAVCKKERIDEIIIAIPSAPCKELRAIVECCRETKIMVKTLPGVGELIDCTVSLAQAREVDLNDLLGRSPVRLDTEDIKIFLQGKRILITGAAGSIGSEICRQVARFKPAEMVLFDNAETPLFFIEKELKEHFRDQRINAIIGDVRNQRRVEGVFADFQPEVVFHAAAYKHVPMMEANPASAAVNNVLGTKIVADAAHAFGAASFVMISTDKAVRPTNVMGATKRAAELYVQNLSLQSKTRFVTVRFGNVLGSNGSVVPIFKEQIRKGGPVTVTHPEVTRFFMTIPEATQLVIQAGSMGRGAEIFLLDMGEPVKITQLAEELIRLSGFRPYEDIEIKFTGLRPGEKLYEELLLAGEGIQPTSHEKIMVARSTHCNWNALNLNIERLFQKAGDLDMHAVVAMLREIVPEYRSQGKWLESFSLPDERGIVGTNFIVHNWNAKASKFLNPGMKIATPVQSYQKELTPSL
jgi:FlaA1/EpsC-like NDP-sugar epimerase